jgi:hypothetical protein
MNQRRFAAVLALAALCGCHLDRQARRELVAATLVALDQALSDEAEAVPDAWCEPLDPSPPATCPSSR